MVSVLFLSDVVLEPVIKEINSLAPGTLSITSNYEEDIIARLLTITEADLLNYDCVFIHSDQIFHRKDQSWQRSLCQAVLGLSAVYAKKIIFSNALSQSYAAAPQKHSLGGSIDALNNYSGQLLQLANRANVYFFDFYGICSGVGLNSAYNYNLGHLYQMPYTKPAIKSFASELIAQLSFLFTEEKKVIILDCDNTLWKGVIGEDGIDSIACDKNGDGILYYNFQLFIKAKKEEGFLLCLCSKNNEEDVKEAFTKLNFPLKWTDFIVKKINWQDKVENIKQIGKELNLGVSSFIFIDDNLFELNSIAQLLSDVSCIHFTGSYPDFITMSNSFLFRRKLILSEDLEKTNQYIQEQLRSEHEAAFNSIDDFISSLDIKLDIRLNDFADLPRLAQMTGKTNQFNFNKHEYNADELRSFTETGRIYSLKVSDKYGDYGTVGLILMKLNGRQAVLENYLLSCRSLGKKIEYTFFDHVKNQLLSEGIEITDIQFKANDKNLPAQTFIKSINYGSKS